MFYTKLDNRDYFDLVVTKDCRDFYRDINECKLISIDLTKSLCSDPGIVQSESVELKNITLTGYDNFFIASGTTFNLQNFVWMTSSPYWFNTTFTWNGNSGADGTITGLTQNNSNLILNIDPNLTYVVETGDTFCLHEVSGYTEQYTYGIDHLQLDKGVYYNELKGGFYQGFYKIFGQNVEWFPSRAKRGWTVDMIVHFPMDISGSTTGTTLNNVYPSNSGFVFYMGTRAENKFIDETPIEIQKLNNSYNIVPLNTENLYLLPNKAVTIPFFAFEVCGLDPNMDITVSFDREKFNIRNKNENGKVVYPTIPVSNWADILTFNTGFGNNTSFDSFNVIVNPFIGSFMTNKNGLTTYTETITRKNYNLIPFNNRLKLFIDGPSTGSVGDVLEYTVTLMDKNLSNTFTNAPATLECYPTVDAGELSHRKVILKNGVGKFKVDTKNLYSGDSFDVKIGWKYITSDSKVTVTLS